MSELDYVLENNTEKMGGVKYTKWEKEMNKSHGGIILESE